MSTFMLIILLVASLIAQVPAEAIYSEAFKSLEMYAFPELPYEYDALEPFMDQATLKVHHQGHHSAYTAKMNSYLKQLRSEVCVNKLCSNLSCDGSRAKDIVSRLID